MSEEQDRLLRENNQMLKYICSYINYRMQNGSNELFENFIVNLAADRLGNKMGYPS